MVGKALWRQSVALSLATALCACPAPTGPAGPAPATTQATLPAGDAGGGRVFESRVEEKNLLLENRQAATQYLRAKLVSLLAERLSALGFDPAGAARLAASGQAAEFEVRGHRERFAGREADAGKIVEAEVFDVRGRLRLVLSDNEVEELYQILQSLPVSNRESAEKLAEYLEQFARLEPPAEKLNGLRERLAESWAKILEADLMLLREIKPQDAEPPELAGATEQLRRFSAYFAGHSRLEPLYVQLAQGWLRWLLQLGDRPLAEQRPRLLRVRQAAAGLLPLMNYVDKAVELAWRDRIFKLDDQHVPFAAIREEFLVFLEEFPSSRFYSEMELRFVDRWVEHLLKIPVGDLESLSSLQLEVQLLGQRFPTLSRRTEVESRLARECLRLLSAARPTSLEAMTGLRQLAARCEPFLPAGAETVQMKKNLDDVEQQLVKERDDGLEKAALKDLNFFIAWEKAARGLKWGSTVKEWSSAADFARLWAEGRDAGADCQCNLDPEEPCRVFQEQSERGRFQVTARFFQNKLFGLDLCNLWVGDGLAAVYNFFSRRYQRRHSPQQASRLIATGEGEVTFGKKDDLLWLLSCRMGTCLVQVREARLYKLYQQQQREENRQFQDAQAEQRKQRLQRGWQKGDCVRWGCGAECLFQGRVESREQNRYRVVVEEARENPRLQGRREWVPEEELYDCL